MNRRIKILCLLTATLMVPAVVYAVDEDQGDHVDVPIVVKDSTITSEIKAKLREQHSRTLSRIDVDTDDRGIVKLSGHVWSQQEMDKAISIARDVQGVREVKNDLKVKHDD